MANRGLPVENDKCRICRQAKETVMHWLLRCARLAVTEYLKRHNNSLMMLCMTSGIHEGLLGKKRNGTKKGRTREQSLRMMNVSYVGTLNITYGKQKQQGDRIWPSNMKTRKQCGCKALNAATKIPTTRIWDQRERQQVYNVMIIPIVIGCLGGDAGRVTNQIGWLISRRKQERYRTKWWRQYSLRVKA